MGNCWSNQSDSSAGNPNSNTVANHQVSSQFSATSGNFTRLLRNTGNSTSLGRSSFSAGNSRLFGASSSNTFSTSNTSTSFGGSGVSENGRSSQLVRSHEDFPNGQIFDTPNLRIFSFAELKLATKDFRNDAVVGEGGFGRVYKGCVKEKIPQNRCGELVIAIKRLNSQSRQGLEEWQSEVNFLGRLSHPNLVTLLGFGQDNGELLLVYEFMRRGSLENQLFGRGSTVRPLSWDTRLNIMIGAAKGLAFLHSLEKKIIYRDFKPSNILLDKSYTAKLSDFGLAKVGPSADQSHVTTRVVGTVGYAAPEYIATGHLYIKSDVYGFGIVLVEILTGKRITDLNRLREHHSLIDWVKSNLLNRRNLRATMDCRLEGKYPLKLAIQVARLALKCILSEPKYRPSMTEVAETLEHIEAANEKPTDNKARATHSRPAQQHGRPDGG
ncbi:Protein kinase [Quillaja saponaria]|uniref:Protein kinase n=1 Tax=Quillaja saponaria TaxID=32244 RepID=A0AAD7LD04_QUISA|nr:Protein kinase [Quillaja saponaria]